MSFNLQRLADEQSASLYFTCSQCDNECSVKQARSGCAICSGSLFKVARRSTIGLPLMDDPDAQEDPYSKKHQNVETTLFSEEGPTSTMGGPNDRDPVSEYNSNPDRRPLPSDGGLGDAPPPQDSYTSQVADTSPLKQPTQQRDVNPFNFMRTLTQLDDADPYELTRKRKFK